MPVLSRRDESPEQRRAAEGDLLRATQELLAQGGTYADLSVDRIARYAGKSRTAFYFYFRDKRELLMRLTEQVAALLWDETDRWWSGEGGVDDLHDALAKVLAAYREHTPLLRAVVEAATYDDEVSEFWRELVGRFIAATERRLIAEGVPGDTARAKAFLLVWMTERACYQHLVRGAGLDDDALIDALVDVWRGTVERSGA